MRYKALFAAVGVILYAALAILSQPETCCRIGALRDDWHEVAPGVYRTPTAPYGYALVHEGHALLIDTPRTAERLRDSGVRQIDAALLTHHHRDSCAAAETYLKDKVPVRAAKASAEWLTVEGVRKFWSEAVPLRSSRTAYLVRPTGLEGVDCSLEDGQTIEWNGWTVTVVATPGHSRDHLAFAAVRAKGERPIVFCGDAMCEPGKMWTPFTTDWDHWTDAGLKPAAESLRKLAALGPRLLLPAHGEPIDKTPGPALLQTAATVGEVGFLKSFERYSKERLKNAPEYPFLVPKEQVASAGEKPWAKVSDHLYITGNTYVLLSKDANAFLVFDPWGQRSIDQIAKLKKDLGLGEMEVVLFSHAHYDHFDGYYLFPMPVGAKVWALDRVAEPLADPRFIRAPFLDPRPIRFDKRFKDGDTADWREYRFKFHFLPGQSLYTMGVETTIDGKRCLFTADNFFHQDQFSGTGGWMGLNRSNPPMYGASARKVLDLAPEWVLAEHGGPYVFNAEDYRRRVSWGEAGAMAADAMCPGGDHRRDWDPYRVEVRPYAITVKAGAGVTTTLMAHNVGKQPDAVTVTLEGRGLTPDQTWELTVPAGGTAEKAVAFRLSDKVSTGRHPFALRVRDAAGSEWADAFVIVDVE
jgi:glyoxylase-like metal-dependent hydrolase (beta-lactamase superfamily II)